MELNADELVEFRDLWNREFGEEITNEQAQKEVCRLLLLVKFAAEGASVKVEIPQSGKNETEDPPKS